MPRKIPRLLWAALPLAYLLYFYGLGTAGLLGPDEPRYASIGRAMASTGDWITPRLWGQPWFEKPALLYWMTAAGFRLGLGPDLAPRLPVALLAVAFLAFFWWVLRREFGCMAAGCATLILGTSVEWLVFSQVGVTDLPLAATFSAAMLLALPWVRRGETRWLPWAGAFLGLAVLAKGLVPLALAAPLGIAVWRRPLREALRAMVLLDAPLVLVAAPWYLLCYRANGMAFLYDFFWVHHFERVTSAALMHVEPWWFYGKILVAALLPWTPLILSAARPSLYRDRGRLFLLAIVLWGIVFFSIPLNKLPGYLLPVLPATAALFGIALQEAPRAKALLAACALLLAVFPIMAPILPQALASGLSKAPFPPFRLYWLLPIGVAAAVWMLDARNLRIAAVFAVAAGACAGVVYLKSAAMPQVDRLASSRVLWQEVASQAEDTCVENIHRNWRYPLNYYSVEPLPECSVTPRRVHIFQIPGQPPGVSNLVPSVGRPIDPLRSGIVRSRIVVLPRPNDTR
jgi:4-amino-4-deoxy-L-arabinose transferase-like glycosyltransferase